MVVFNNILRYNSATVHIGSYLDVKEERLSASVGPRPRRFGAEKDEVLVIQSHHIVTCHVNHSAAFSQDDHVLSYINLKGRRSVKIR